MPTARARRIHLQENAMRMRCAGSVEGAAAAQHVVFEHALLECVKFEHSLVGIVWEDMWRRQATN